MHDPHAQPRMQTQEHYLLSISPILASQAGGTLRGRRERGLSSVLIGIPLEQQEGGVPCSPSPPPGLPSAHRLQILPEEGKRGC